MKCETICAGKEDEIGGWLVVLQKRVPEVEIKSDRARIDCWAGLVACTAQPMPNVQKAASGSSEL